MLWWDNILIGIRLFLENPEVRDRVKIGIISSIIFVIVSILLSSLAKLEMRIPEINLTWDWLPYLGYAVGGLLLILLIVWVFRAIRKNGNSKAFTGIATGAKRIGSGIGPLFAWLLVIVFLGIAIFRYGEAWLSELKNKEVVRAAAAAYQPASLAVIPNLGMPYRSIYDLPQEIFEPVVTGCESGDLGPGSGRQFREDGSVVTNVNSNGSVDYGKWQINSIHEEEWSRLGINIMTESGNDEFATILIERGRLEGNPLRDWEASRWCWEATLLAYIGFPPANQRRTVEVGTDGTSYISIPGGWGLQWAPAERRDAKFRVEPLGGEPVDFPTTERFALTGDASMIRFRSLETTTVKLQVWFVVLPQTQR
jgi:hypothetical protein